jgi:hypothetical protein
MVTKVSELKETTVDAVGSLDAKNNPHIPESKG